MVYLKRILRLSLILTAMIAVLAGAALVIAPRAVDFASAHRSEHDQLSLDDLAESSYIYDSAGNKMATLVDAQNTNRVAVPIEQVPDTVKWAVLSVEDANFYEHKGINIRSILRAVDANLESGSVSQGGSTITQQVVKNSLLTSDQNISRKLREAFLAVELEKQRSKDEILEYYLNSVYLGGGSYGVQAASQYYFRKNVQELNWAEGAMLASIIRNPSNYDPFKNPKLVKERRKVSLSRIVATGHLTEDEAKFFNEVALPTEPNIPAPPSDYFTEDVKAQLLNDPKYGLGLTPAARNRTVFSGGIKVYTTLDPVAQQQAEEARNAELHNNRGDGTFDMKLRDGTDGWGTAALASVEPSTGAVRALVGGPGSERDPKRLNLATGARQPGSTMKTFTLAAAIEDGYLPTDTVGGGSCSFKEPGKKEPYSVSGRAGTGTIRSMTLSSNNCAFLRLANVIGNEKVTDLAKRLGVTSCLNIDCSDPESEPPISLTLGSKEISPLEMAAAYAVFANDGIRNEAYYIERIVDRDGKVLYQHQATPERVIEPQVARLVTEVLEGNVKSGTGTRASIDNGQPAAGKTGTTNDSSDVWFVGYTPALSTAVWIGSRQGNSSLAGAGMAGATGGKFAATIWGYFYDLYQADRPIEEFRKPDKATRSGKYIGRADNEIGGGGTGSGSRPKRPSTGGTTPTTAPSTDSTTPTTPTDPTPSTPTTPTDPGGGGGGTPGGGGPGGGGTPGGGGPGGGGPGGGGPGGGGTGNGAGGG